MHLLGVAGRELPPMQRESRHDGSERKPNSDTESHARRSRHGMVTIQVTVCCERVQFMRPYIPVPSR